MRSPALVALAAGLSTRFGRAKQAEPLGPNGETLLEYTAWHAAQAGFQRICLVVAPESGAAALELAEPLGRHLPTVRIEQRLDDLPGGRRPPDGRQKPWGTAQAVWACREAINGPFAVVNADDYYGLDAFRALAEQLSEDGASEGPRPTYALVGYRLGDTLSASGGVSRAACRVGPDGFLVDVEETLRIRRTADGTIEGFSEEGSARRLSEDQWVSTNLWGFDPSVFELLSEALIRFLDQGPPGRAELHLPTVIRHLLDMDGIRVRLLPHGRHFLGITHPEDRQHVVETLRRLGAGPRST